MFKPIKSALKKVFIAVVYGSKSKVFCIGRNKTGTTSIAKLLKNHGYFVAPQWPAEKLVDDWAKRDFRRLFKFVKYRGQAFQDIPFSLPDTYKALDKKFPNSKFILTVRDSADQWYNSLIRFHSKIYGNGSIPTKEDLIKAKYKGKGYPWKVNRYVYATPEDSPYDKDTLIGHYNQHNKDVLEYFQNTNKLLVVNLRDADAQKKIGVFLEITEKIEIPWKNKT